MSNGDDDDNDSAPRLSYLLRFNTPLRFIAGWISDANVRVGSWSQGSPATLSLSSSSLVTVSDTETLLYKVPMYSEPSREVQLSYYISYRTRPQQPTSTCPVRRRLATCCASLGWSLRRPSLFLSPLLSSPPRSLSLVLTRSPSQVLTLYYPCSRHVPVRARAAP
jgi:hypothetical protein